MLAIIIPNKMFHGLFVTMINNLIRYIPKLLVEYQ